MAARRVFVRSIEGAEAAVEGAEAHHLARVVRLKAGEEVEISDGRRLFRARTLDVAPRRVRFAVEERLPTPETAPEVTLQVAVFQFARFDWVLEKATELGVSRVVPVIAERTESRLAKAVPKRLDRWRRIAEQAAQQSRRLAAPAIDEVTDFGAALLNTRPGARIVLHPGGDLLGAILAETAGQPVQLLVGPEGGWTDAEVSSAAGRGYRRAGMGPLILRCETAAIAALAVIAQVSRGGAG